MKQKVPSRDELIRLHNEGYTNAQLAERFGCSEKYISRKRTHSSYHCPVPYEGDPREVLEDQAPFISDETVERWRQHRECLCGCGGVVGYRTEPDHKRALKAGHPSFFMRGHNRRMMPKGYYSGAKRPHADLVKISEGLKKRSISTYGISFVIDDYLEREGKTIRQFAEEIGASKTWVTEIRSGRITSIRKSSAIRLLTAMGEPIRPDLLPPELSRQGKRYKEAS